MKRSTIYMALFIACSVLAFWNICMDGSVKIFLLEMLAALYFYGIYTIADNKGQ